MELRFTRPDLRQLDLCGSEVLACGLASDERPPRGVAGLVDFRIGGRISRLAEEGFATGELGEVLLLPGRPKLPFDKIVLFGLGERARFDERSFQLVVERLLNTLEGLRARSPVVELPGRHWDALPVRGAVDILLQAAAGRRAHDVWTLVEAGDAHRLVTQQLQQERRRRG